MTAETVPSVSQSLLSVEELACSASTDAHHHVPQDFPFPEPSCMSELFESNPRLFSFVVDPTQTGLEFSLHLGTIFAVSPGSQRCTMGLIDFELS